MQVSEIMTKDPACCTPDAGLPEIVNLMIENDCGSIPVVESFQNTKPVGTITDRDLAIRSFTAGQNPFDLKASDVMTRQVITIKPELSLEECCNVMEDSQIRRVLVTDENNCLCGIVAQADIAEYASPQQTAEVVSEISDTSTKFKKTAGKNYGNGESWAHAEALLALLAGIGSGAALMYFLDPDRGRRRRALVGDQITHLTTNAQKTFGRTQRDLQNRVKGLWTETKKAVGGSVNATENKTDKNVNLESAARQS